MADLSKVYRVMTQKRSGFDTEAKQLYGEVQEVLEIPALKELQIINRYDVQGIGNDAFEKAVKTVFSEPNTDYVYYESLPDLNARFLAVEPLPGQFDQRADSAEKCIQLLINDEGVTVKTAKIFAFIGDITGAEFANLKAYMINPIEAREASMDKPESIQGEYDVPADVPVIKGFIKAAERDLKKWKEEWSLAMSFEDLSFCQKYFKKQEKRDPTLTEIRVLDTYWSDHCRHTTFLTALEDIKVLDGTGKDLASRALEKYRDARKRLYGEKAKRPECLMDIAVIGMKELKLKGMLDDLDESEEINACSIEREIDVIGEDGRIRKERWLIMFKNETHNHPTEIEPYGGAATCLGGAIRDPLSGRSYVYQAMRITGSGDPRLSFDKTLSGKLPQRKITASAAAGYSSYGNQIGLQTGKVEEIYHPGYVAKRMELGAVVGAAPKQNVIRKTPEAGDFVILLGGRTGRDGCGGATGSSKAHDKSSLESCGAEVQKGNPLTERAIQRLFRDPELTRMIKRCNDFGAGGVSVAIGELADSLSIDLDAVPKKYDGLDGTELAISESQERMACVVAASDAQKFIDMAAQENLEATIVAAVTAEGRLKMKWRGKTIVDISREFLNSNGAEQRTKAQICVNNPDSYFAPDTQIANDFKKALLDKLSDINFAGKRGLVERFDATIGANSVLSPFGGKYASTPTDVMAAKIPILKGNTNACTIMAHGFDPYLSELSPFHGAVYAIVDALTKIAAAGGDALTARLSLQEFFESLGKDPIKWGKPLAALLGAYLSQLALDVPAIGGKDSMSGTFDNLTVPPTLVAFAITVDDAKDVISPEFKGAGHDVAVLSCVRGSDGIPDFEKLKRNFTNIKSWIRSGKILAAKAVGAGGFAESIAKMSFGNRVGFKSIDDLDLSRAFAPDFGSIIIELADGVSIQDLSSQAKQDLSSQAHQDLSNKANEGLSIQGISSQGLSNQGLSDQAISTQGSSNKVALTGETGGLASTGKINELALLGKTTAAATLCFNQFNICIEEAVECWEKPLESVFPTKTEDGAAVPTLAYVKRARQKTTGPKFAKPRVVIPVFPGNNCEYDCAKAFEKAGAIANFRIIRNMNPSALSQSIEELAKDINNSQIIMLPGGFSMGDEPDGSAKFIATAFRSPAVADAVMNLLNKRDGLIIGICNGFQALIKLGLLPYGEIRVLGEKDPTLTFNLIGRHVARQVRTCVSSLNSPWLAGVNMGDVFNIPVSHGEGRFVASESDLQRFARMGQIAFQYCDENGVASASSEHNPNGSMWAVEGLLSPDGRILGKMAHSERLGDFVGKNVHGQKDQKLFVSGVEYFS